MHVAQFVMLLQLEQQRMRVILRNKTPILHSLQTLRMMCRMTLRPGCRLLAEHFDDFRLDIAGDQLARRTLADDATVVHHRKPMA